MDANRGDDLNMAADHLGPHTMLFEFNIPKDRRTVRQLLQWDMGVLVGTGTKHLRWWAAQEGAEGFEKEMEMVERFARELLRFWTSVNIFSFEHVTSLHWTQFGVFCTQSTFLVFVSLP